METSRKSSGVIFWWNRILSLVFVGVVYCGLWDFGFSWLWYRVTPPLGMTPRLSSSCPWIQLYANHLWEIVIALPLILLFGGRQWRVWSGLNLGQSRLSLNCFWKALIFSHSILPVDSDHSSSPGAGAIGFLSLRPNQYPGHAQF
jgi:hypothetical protein